MISKRNPAHAGPKIRPKLIKEVLNPMALPCAMVALFDMRDEMAGRSKELAAINRPTVRTTS